MRTFAWAIAAVALLAQRAHAAPTADELVAKNVAARGGAGAHAALESLRLTGKARVQGGNFSIELDWAQAFAGKRMRREQTLQGLTAVEATDGEVAWSVSPFQGRKEAERTSKDEARALADAADLLGALVHARAEDRAITLLGNEDVDGGPAWKLRVQLEGDDVKYVYLDPDSFLEIRIQTVRHLRGAEDVRENDFGSYARVGGVVIPLAIDAGGKGGPKNFHIAVEHAEPGVQMDDILFRMPPPGATSGRSIVAGANPPPPENAEPAHAAQSGEVRVDSGVVSGLGARNIGSAAMSGRISAVAGAVVDGKTLLFVGAASGGVWRSRDGGTTFQPVFDKEKVQSIGAIAIDPRSPRTIWVGTGEGWTRNSVSVGDGIYKSTDGGDTWTNMGLPESERIVRIAIDPRDSNVVWACAPGKLWSDSRERGLYKTTDGGKTWTLALAGKNGSTGCSGVSLDPQNPDNVLAGLWDFRRKGWTFRSGGDGPDAPSGSGLFRSTDGGRSWTEVENGLHKKPWGRVEVTFAPSDPKIAFALVESGDSALYRSADGGQTWEARDKSQMMVWRPFYFARLVVDPKNPERVFKAGGDLIVSDDGGKSFSSAGGGGHGDWHDVWIDPTNTQHVVAGDDGGLWLSFDGASRWFKENNLPVSQFYHVAVDDRDPYHVFGGLQDNSSWEGPSAYGGGITNARWENLLNGDGFWVVPDPTDEGAVYAESQGGFISRVDRRLQRPRDIQPKAGYREKLRFNWNAPIARSPTDAKTLYLGAQFLFRSRDRGDNWERISPDLTTNDPEKQKQEQSGGVTVDNSSAEMHTTIYSISESPLDRDLIWVGTDDGNVQLTRDGGKTWRNVVENVPGLPAHSWVSWVEASRFEKGTAYAAFDRHTEGDLTPWVFRTDDFGANWTRIVSPKSGVRGYAHVVKEDLRARGLLFVGTEFGLFISIDGGANWAEFKGRDFPSVAVRDLALQARDGDLVLATHGRGLWIIDDLTPLRALSREVLQKPVAFLPQRPVQQRIPASGGWVEGDASFVGENPPGGALIAYYQRARHVYGPLKLEVLDGDGKLVDTLSPTKRRGLNRVAWSMRMKPPRVPSAAQVAGAGTQGPRVLPGEYTVRLTKGGEVIENKLEVGLDRRAPFDRAARKEQLDAVLRVSALFGDMTDLTARIEKLTRAAGERRVKLQGDALAAQLAQLQARLLELRKKIVATSEGGHITGEERLREHADQLYAALLSWEGRPAAYQLERIAVLRRELTDVSGELDALVAGEAQKLGEELRRHGLEPLPTGTAANEPTPPDAAVREAFQCAVSRCDDRSPASAAETR